MSWFALNKHVLLVELNAGEKDHVYFIGAVEGDDYAGEALGVTVDETEADAYLWEFFFDPGVGGPYKAVQSQGLPLTHSGPSDDDEGRHATIYQAKYIDEQVVAVATEAEDETWWPFIDTVRGGWGNRIPACEDVHTFR
jgi:hypothetical protein